MTATTAPRITNWLERGRAFKGAYCRGQVAALEGKDRTGNPYLGGDGDVSARFIQAWYDGYDAAAKARDN